MALQKELAAVLNKYSRENMSNTPDFILAQFILDCLVAYEAAIGRRDSWYDFKMVNAIKKVQGEVGHE